MTAYHFHRHGRQFFYGHGDEISARSFLSRLNHGRTSNLWSMRAEDGKPRGIDLGAELAETKAQQWGATDHEHPRNGLRMRVRTWAPSSTPET